MCGPVDNKYLKAISIQHYISVPTTGRPNIITYQIPVQGMHSKSIRSMFLFLLINDGIDASLDVGHKTVCVLGIYQ